MKRPIGVAAVGRKNYFAERCGGVTTTRRSQKLARITVAAGLYLGHSLGLSSVARPLKGALASLQFSLPTSEDTLQIVILCRVSAQIMLGDPNRVC